MDELQEIDVEQVMERIREHIRRKRNGGEDFTPFRERAGINPVPTPSRIGRGEAPPLLTNGQVASDLTTLHSASDIYHIHFTSHRKIVGPFVVFLKELLRKLLTPILERQVAYNATNARIVAHLQEELETIRQQAQLREKLGEQQAKELQAIAEQQVQLRQEVLGTLAQEIKRLQIEVPTGHVRALEVMRQQVSRAERKLRRILYLLTDGQEVGEVLTPSSIAERTTAQGRPIKVPLQVLEPDFDYFAFEERFRGSEEDIKERQRIYVEYFKGREPVLDIGCGRGEFLSLLKEAGIKANGVDLDIDMALHCQDKGLDVIRKDAFEYLESLPDESLGGVFAAQVIEHLEPSRIVQLVKLSHRKLRQGGVLILETPNPKCLTVFAENFYMDLSHIRLVHPEAMKFLLEMAGFNDVELKFSAPAVPSMRIPSLPESTDLDFRDVNQGIERVNELLYGFQDYAVIGRKSRGLR